MRAKLSNSRYRNMQFVASFLALALSSAAVANAIAAKLNGHLVRWGYNLASFRIYIIFGVKLSHFLYEQPSNFNLFSFAITECTPERS